MILALTPNPALDVTYEVPGFRAGHEHRVRTVRTAAGGKGVNAARVAAALGARVRTLGPLGGATGARLRDLLAADPGAARLDQAWTPVDGGTRRTITVLDGQDVTGLNEPGPALSAAERDRLRADVRAALSADGVRALAISGSLPGGLDEKDVAGVVREAAAQGVPVLVDTSGPGLLAAARAGADLLKPNRAEAEAATGQSDPLRAALALVDLGARAVVCSLGPDGMLLVERAPDSDAPDSGAPDSGGARRAHRARPDRAIRGNPTGAGDAAVAELTLALARREPLPAALARAVATSASAVARPRAGEIDLPLRERLLPLVRLEEIPCP